MGYNLTDEFISASFQQLVQYVDSSSVFVDGTGSLIPSVSFTASNAISASYAVSASQASNSVNAEFSLTATSASHALNADDAISSSYALSASQADNATTASHATSGDGAFSGTFTGDLTGDVTGDLTGTATTASYIEGSNVDGAVAEADAADRVEINVRAAEALTKGDPVYISGYSVGQGTPLVSRADASSASTMAAVGLASASVDTNTNTVVIGIGSLTNVDTVNDFDSPVVGDTVYVKVGGGLTNVRPTGSANLIQNVGKIGRVQQNNGEILASAIQRSNDVPNIQEGYVWVGNSDGVAVAVTSQSLYENKNITVAQLTASNADIANAVISSATITSASIGYLESITGSAKIIGDAFVIVNADTPTQRYAGIAVYDSGSAVTPHTASLQFDGQTNDWFYQYTGSDSTNFGVLLFGPEYTTKGSPTYPTDNALVKGDGGHHLESSNIYDFGSFVQVQNVDVAIENALIVNDIISCSGNIQGLGFTGTLTGNVTGDLTGTALAATNIINVNTNDRLPVRVSGGMADSKFFDDGSSEAGVLTGRDFVVDDSVVVGGSISVNASINATNGTANLNNVDVAGDIQIDGKITEDIQYVNFTGNVDIDLSLGNFFFGTATADCTIGINNITSGKGQTVNITLKNPNSRTISFDSVIKWPGGIAPTITAGGTDIITLIISSTSSDVYGSIVQDLS